MQEEITPQNEVSLREYLELLRRRKAIIIQTFLAVAIIGFIVAYVSRPVFKSSGRLLVAPQSNSYAMGRTADDPLRQLFESTRAHTIETQLEILMTPDLLAEAYDLAGVRPDDSRVRPNVGRTGDNVDIIDITVEAHTAEIAMGVANNMMTLYIDRTEEMLTGDIDKSIKFASDELKQAKADWENAAVKLDEYQRRVKLTDYATQVQTRNASLAELEKKEDLYEADLLGMDASIATVKSELKKLPPTITKTTTAPNNVNRDRLQEQLTTARANYKGNEAIYKLDHVKMKALRQQIEDLEEKLNAMPEFVTLREETTNPEIRVMEEKLRTLQAQRTGMVATLAKVVGQKEQAAATLSQLSKYQYTQAKLIQDRDIAQNKYKVMSDKLDNLQLQKIAQPKSVGILTRAQTNNNWVRPNRPLIIAMAMIAGLFLGICFALLQEFLDDRVNAPEDARRVMGVPALGYIPRIEKADQRMLTNDKSGGSLLESYRVLRSNVRFAAVGEPLNTIMVTSTAPGEGKSMTSCNLAIAMALDGKRVILVDADLRRPTVHEKFGMRNTPGLTNVLVGALPLDKALQDTEIENLQILASGPIPPNPAELLNSNAMVHVQDQLKQRADVVIFDSPPCLSVADAQVMSSTVDGVIYVVQLGSTKKSALRHGQELLRQAQARVLGVVYNKLQVDNRRSDYYYGYYSYYHKAELPSKANGNGNGKKSNGSSEWEALTAQANEMAAPAGALPASEKSSENASKSEDKA